MGNSLAVELPALDRAALVRIQISQPLCRRLPGSLVWSYHSSRMPPYSVGFAADGYSLRYRETARSPESCEFRPGVSNEAFECTAPEFADVVRRELDGEHR